MAKGLSLSIITLVIFFFACKVPMQKSKNDSSTVIIELEKKACMGPCPVYTLKISEDGYALLDAKENLEVFGLHKSKLGKEELEALISKFEALNFFDLNNSYKSPMMDLQTKYISYTKNGNTKRIMAYDNIPPKLSALINEIDTYTNSLNWKKVND